MKVHLINCTYCEYRLVTQGNKKKSLPEIERCQFTSRLIPSPSQSGRFCSRFHQIGHDCASCWSE